MAKYAQIVGRDYVSGAMENTTAVIHERICTKSGRFSRRKQMGRCNRSRIIPPLVRRFGNQESWSNLTVNESFCADYSEYLWNEYKYGKDEADYKD